MVSRPLLAEHVVGAGPTVHVVAVTATEHGVFARTAKQRVLAELAEDGVVAFTAVQPVACAVVALIVDVTGGVEIGELETVEAVVVPGIAGLRVFRPRRVVEHGLRVVPVEGVAVAAVEDIVPLLTEQGIAADTARGEVVEERALGARFHRRLVTNIPDIPALGQVADVQLLVQAVFV